MTERLLEAARKILRDIRDASCAEMAWAISESNMGQYLKRKGWVNLSPPKISLTAEGEVEAQKSPILFYDAPKVRTCGECALRYASPSNQPVSCYEQEATSVAACSCPYFDEDY